MQIKTTEKRPPNKITKKGLAYVDHVHQTGNQMLLSTKILAKGEKHS
jgi:hypothetical protein